MNDEAALLAAITAHADEDTPRLAYADWLDENQPDGKPSPVSGPSARAEYIRVQCRLAQRAYDDPEYPALREREEELAHWLDVHGGTGPADSFEIPGDLEWYDRFTHGDDGVYRRGFPEELAFTDYDEEPEENIERIVSALPVAFATSTVRALRLEEVYGAEVAGIVSDPVAAGLRGLSLDYIDDGDETTAVRAIAKTEHLTGLQRLRLEFSITDTDLKRLAKASLDSLEELILDEFTPVGGKALGAARWFRSLRVLQVGMENRDALRAIGELPVMPNLVAFAFPGDTAPTMTAVRKFVASSSFPRLNYLEFVHAPLSPEQVVVLSRGTWPLRHLKLHNVDVRKAGAEALANANFAESLRVLDLSDCEITAGGIQALAGSAKFAGLLHLDLSDNPIGPGGLLALARSPHLRGLRKLSLHGCNSTKAPIDSAALLNFLTALEMPELRHLSLTDLPVGVRGAKAIAAGGTFANLTRLDLANCGLREKGARAIVESPALGNLTVLDLSGNNAGRGIIKLANPKTFPRLGHCDLNRNRPPKGWLARLRKRRGVSV